MDSDLAGRVRNTSLPKSKNLLPVFEAVVNSIQALEESQCPLEKARIEVEIVREPVLREGKDGPDLAKGPIKNIFISDNGPGFNEENMASFSKLDSSYKLKLGCKGFGRVLWLKAFEKAKIESIFKNKEGQYEAREFVFSVTPGHEIEPPDSKATEATDTHTTIRLLGLRDEYACTKPPKASHKDCLTIAFGIFCVLAVPQKSY